MPNVPSISIIVPVYNVEDYVQECIESVLSQNYDGEVECIVIDDCGSDASMDIVKKIVKEYSGTIQFRIIRHNQNKGLSAARNTGIDAAEHEYILFIDSDDYLEPSALSTLTKEFDNENLIVARFTQTNGITSSTPAKTEQLFNKECLNSFLNRKYPITAWNKLYSRQFLQDNNLRFLEGVLYEDLLWSIQVAERSTKIKLISKPTYVYRIREASISHAIKGEKEIKDKTLILSKVVDFCKEVQIIDNIYTQEYITQLKSDLIRSMKFPEKRRYQHWKIFNSIFSPSLTKLLKGEEFSLLRIIKESYSWLPTPIGYIWWVIYTHVRPSH